MKDGRHVKDVWCTWVGVNCQDVRFRNSEPLLIKMQNVGRLRMA